MDAGKGELRELGVDDGDFGHPRRQLNKVPIIGGISSKRRFRCLRAQSTMRRPNTDNVSVLTIHLSSDQKPFQSEHIGTNALSNATTAKHNVTRVTPVEHFINTSNQHLSVRQIDVHHIITTKTTKRTFSTHHASPTKLSTEA